MAVVNIAGIILTFLNIFQCSPVSAAWNPYYVGKVRCIPLLTEFICSSPINIITNLCLLFLPIPVLTGMRLPKRQKIAVVFLFSLGIFVTIVDVVRIHFLQSALSEAPTGASSTAGSTFGGQADFAWNASLSFMWSAVEVNIGITCACIPTLKPLIMKLLPSILYDPDRSNTTISKPRESDSPDRHDHSPNSELQAPAAAVLPNQSTDQEQSAQDQQISAMEFLTVPDGLDSSPNPDFSSVTRARTNMTTNTNTNSSEINETYFGFVNMARPKSMLRTSASESFKYCSTVAILFLLWGVSYGLLNTLNNVVAAINGYSTAQTLGLTSAYFGGGYLFGPLLVGEWILRRDEHNRSRRHRKNEFENVGGFKVTFIIGLSIYGIGTIIFWPSAVTASYGGFMVSNFIVGFGLSVLEVAANAFIILCGPQEYGETRLLLAQAVQAVGTVLSGLLANKVFFNNIGGEGFTRNTTLINVQWTYLAITLLCAALGLFFYYMPLPEVSDQELEESAKRLPVNPQKKSIFGMQLRTVSLILAVAAQYLYVAAQESNSIYFRDLLISILPYTANSGEDAATGNSGSATTDRPPGIAVSITDYLLIGHTGFAVSRFLAGYLTYASVHHPRVPRPRTLLTIFLVLSFLFALLPVVLHPYNANLLVIPVILFFFAEGPVWPLIFAIGLRGQGRRTKRAAAFITMGGSGGGVAPFVMYGIVTTGGSIQTSYIVIVVLQVLMMCYPLFLETVRDARAMVEPVGVPAGMLNNTDVETPTDEVVAARIHHQEKAHLHNRLFGKVVDKFTGGRRQSSPQAQTTHSEDREST